ncbi:helix-turn-helix transcriptional regulator [Paraburkholderia xenovorans]|uniref:helix-turn-helix transcriptional regulator n=1 Tax=Paraburkholderia xenovorans TaxID=36873 RepID=UPI0020A648C9|nr:transcriptional regulator [Paraburkholderia xenovorans]
MTRNYTAGARRLHPNTHALTEGGQPTGPLLPGGLSRFNDIKPYLPVSRETWRLMVIAGSAPQLIRLKPRSTVWHNDEVNAWLANPAAFKVEG